MPVLNSSLRWLVAQLLPAACPLCLTVFPSAWQQPFCATCLDGFKPLPAACCPRCALPFTAATGSCHLCGRCTLKPPAYHGVHCLGLYEQQLRRAIHLFKFNQQVGLDRPLAQLLNCVIGNVQFDLIVPVPLHPQRLRQRSYNQALLLARELGRLRKLPVAASLLQKQRDTPAQQQLSAREREGNLQGAFLVSRPLNGGRLLLVDDVMTTGTTVAVAAKLLRRAGAAEVQVAVLGRAPSDLPLSVADNRSGRKISE